MTDGTNGETDMFFEDVEKSMEQNNKELMAKARKQYEELKRLFPNDDSDPAKFIAAVAKELAQHRSLPPKVIEFRRNLRQYLDDGLTVYEAQRRAIQDFEEIEFLRDTDSNILDCL